MRIFVRLRHWQLFLVLTVPFFIGSYFMLQPIGFFMNVLAMFILLSWAVSIRIIGGQVRSGVRWIYWLLLLIPSVYLAFFSSFAADMVWQNERLPSWVVVPHLLSMGCIFFLIFSAAKTLQSLKLGRVATFGDYFGYGMAIWFFPVGIWFVQPKVNDLIGMRNTEFE